jgi:long-subunit acyl-CoA synthetase (AMP-forming)
MYGGGPLSPQVAESLISQGVSVTGSYGGTEFGIVSESRWDSSETWQYVQFQESVNIRWASQGDGTFEAQFLNCDSHQVAIENLPDVSGYATEDLFEPHPTIPNLWKIVGRVDDVLTHSSGEKTVPAPMEAIISANPM